MEDLVRNEEKQKEKTEDSKKKESKFYSWSKFYTFNKYRFIPIPSISLYHGEIIPNTSSLSPSPTSISPPTVNSVIMGGRNLCSLIYRDIIINHSPQTITYDRAYWTEDIGFLFFFSVK
jgi:hypothetical protein